jgi:exodeoxyribonuclease VII small subunit
MSAQAEQSRPEGRPRLRACLARLEEIARDMAREDVEIEDALALHEEGMGLLAVADEILETARLQVERVTAPTARPRFISHDRSSPDE